MVLSLIAGLVTFAVWMAIFSIKARLQEEKQKQLFHDQLCSYVSDFSTSAYMGRIEKAAVEIMQEAQNRTEYQLVLWAGLDGLRVNEDGTAEWIRREKKKPEPLPAQSCVNVPQFYNFPAAQNLFQQNMCCQDNTATLLALQIQQSQNAVNAYHPPYMQATYPYYQSAVTQCCATPPCGGMF